jgi:nucleoside-diphosphate-sugar epimerase
MIVVTGAAGFIASYLAEALNAAGHQHLVLVDDFSTAAKKPNWTNLSFEHCIDREAFFPWFMDLETFLEVFLEALFDPFCPFLESLFDSFLDFFLRPPC